MRLQTPYLARSGATQVSQPSLALMVDVGSITPIGLRVDEHGSYSYRSHHWGRGHNNCGVSLEV
jgi:hypothetical protein